MRSLFASLSAVLLAVAAFGQPPDPVAPLQPTPKDKTVVVPAPNVPGGKVVLVPRDQLRAGPNVKTARLPRAIRAAAEDKAIPVPATWDWTKANTIKMPIYGNDQWGDCYYVAPVKVFQMWHGMNGKELFFDVNAIVKRYRQLSGGDNGLSDYQVFPEVKAGIVGPNGPHKMLDVLIIEATDNTALDLTGWAFGPHMFTFTVYGNFMNVGPGTVLDGNGGGISGGHAVAISGKQADGKRKLETWGIQPSVLVTDRWVRGVEPEFISCFSLEWFNDKGYAPNGEHYEVLAPLWNSLGGRVPVPGPFPPPQKPGPTAKLTANPTSVTPGDFTKGSSVLTWETTGATAVTLNGGAVTPTGSVGVTPAATTTYTLVAAGAAGTTPATATATVTVNEPPPPPPVPFTGTLAQVVNGETIQFDPVKKVVTLPAGWTVAGGGGTGGVGFEAELKAAGICPAAIAAALQLATDLKAKAGMPVILTDLLMLYAAYQSCQAGPMPPMAAVPMANPAVMAAGACSSTAGACGTAGSFAAGECAPAGGFSLRHPLGGRFAGPFAGAGACGQESAFASAGACGASASVSAGACGSASASARAGGGVLYRVTHPFARFRR